MPSADGYSLSAEQIKEIYDVAPGNTAYLVDLSRILDAIISRDASEDTTVETLSTDISALANLIAINSKQILYLHRLIGLLVFELVNQGIEIESKELLNELEIYVKNGI